MRALICTLLVSVLLLPLVVAVAFQTFNGTCPGPSQVATICGCNPIFWHYGYAFFTNGETATVYNSPDCTGPPQYTFTRGSTGCRVYPWNSVFINCEIQHLGLKPIKKPELGGGNEGCSGNGVGSISSSNT
ncbi:hypothetical protein GQ42DRAFT_12318 [Ramicandelaber brevisporus]|nr:hypothetical protein GQ42DRAFT_12318 [Ramicandelaber brevisporus]